MKQLAKEMYAVLTPPLGAEYKVKYHRLRTVDCTS
jgi:hypothetical protein